MKVKANFCAVDLSIEVEQVRLHHSLLEPEGGATSDMGHAGEPVVACVDDGVGNVDAVIEQKTDAHFPGPQDVLPVIVDMDPRVGVCVDIGHTARTGIDLVEVLDMCGDRALDVHMKDLRDLTSRASQCIVGEGKIPVAAIFRQLEKMSYPGYVNLEYEIDADDPLPGMKQSFAYMRGVIAGAQGD